MTDKPNMPPQVYLENWDRQIVQLHSEVKRLRAALSTVVVQCPALNPNLSASGEFRQDVDSRDRTLWDIRAIALAAIKESENV